ncbi:hypothetical protein HDV00_001425, partial [Rhizophlyctis rosea]
VLQSKLNAGYRLCANDQRRMNSLRLHEFPSFETLCLSDQMEAEFFPYTVTKIQPSQITAVYLRDEEGTNNIIGHLKQFLNVLQMDEPAPLEDVRVDLGG